MPRAQSALAMTPLQEACGAGVRPYGWVTRGTVERADVGIGPYGWEHAGMSLGTNGGMDMKKCGYCGKEVKGELDFCSDGCEKSYKDENEKDERRIKYFAGGIVLGLLVIAVSAFTKSVFMVGIGVIIMGIVEFLLPFTTPETIAFLGYKRAKTAGRIAGIVLIAVGIWVGLI